MLHSGGFYRVKRKILTREECEKEDKLYREYEQFLHRFLSDSNAPKRMLLFSYLYYYRCITAPQLFMLSGQSGQLDTQVRYLRRNSSSGYLRCHGVSQTGLNHPLYELSAEGEKLLLSYLKEQSTYPLSRDCLEMMHTRFSKQSPLQSFGHISSVRDFCSCMENICDTPSFHIQMEAVFRLNGESVERYELSRGGIEETGTFQSDALLELPSSPHPVRIYYEQDMSTQKRNVLGKKIGNYCSFCRSTGFENNLLLFALSLPVKTTAAPKCISSDEQSRYRYLKDLPFIAWQYLSLTGDENPSARWEQVALLDIAKQYGDFARTVQRAGRQIENALKYCEELLDEDPYMTVGSAYRIACDGVNPGAQNHVETAELRMAYHSRRSTVRNAAASAEAFSGAALCGMMVGIVPNYNIKEYMSALFPSLFAETRQLLLRIPFLYGLVKKGDASYSYKAIEDTDGMLHFRNAFTFGEQNVYYENIANDAGALHRLFYYLEHVDHCDGVLICITDDDTSQLVRQKIIRSRYMEYVRSGYKIPLQVYFIKQAAFKTCMGLFEYAENGDIKEIALSVS